MINSDKISVEGWHKKNSLPSTEPLSIHYNLTGKNLIGGPIVPQGPQGPLSDFRKPFIGEKDEDEDILARSYSTDEVKTMLNDGKIYNGATIIALQWFYLNYNTN